jgi:hypothetical protein
MTMTATTTAAAANSASLGHGVEANLWDSVMGC